MKQLLTLVLAAVMLCSCTAAEPDMPAAEIPEKNIIRTFGVKDNSLTSYIVDFNNLEYITELSTQIMMLKVLSRDSAEAGEIGASAYKKEITDAVLAASAEE